MFSKKKNVLWKKKNLLWWPSVSYELESGLEMGLVSTGFKIFAYQCGLALGVWCVSWWLVEFNLTSFSAFRKDVPADPNLWYIGVGDANTSQNGGGGDAWTRNSYLARLNYSYSGKYLLTATVRRDGSSRLPSKNRWQNYPSVGLAWVASKEPFMQNQNIFDLLKVRASYGRVGNDQIPSDSYITRLPSIFLIHLMEIILLLRMVPKSINLKIQTLPGR